MYSYMSNTPTTSISMMVAMHHLILVLFVACFSVSFCIVFTFCVMMMTGDSTVASILSGLETRSLGLQTLCTA